MMLYSGESRSDYYYRPRPATVFNTNAYNNLPTYPIKSPPNQLREIGRVLGSKNAQNNTQICFSGVFEDIPGDALEQYNVRLFHLQRQGLLIISIPYGPHEVAYGELQACIRDQLRGMNWNLADNLRLTFAKSKINIIMLAEYFLFIIINTK